MTNVREMYADVEQRLDMDYVRLVAEAVQRYLLSERPIGVAFQPGDGTRYDLAFVPIQNLRFAPSRVVDGMDWGLEAEFGISREPGTAIVVYEQQRRACGHDFRTPGFEPVYLGDVYDTGIPSACTLALLFNTVAEAWNG